MTFREFCSDQRWWTTTFVLYSSFVGSTIMADPRYKIESSSILYIIIGSSMLFLCCFLLQFVMMKKRLSKFQKHLSYSSYEQRYYLRVIEEQKRILQEKITRLQEEQKGQLEYMTTWFHEIKTPIAVSRLIIESDGDTTSIQEEIDRIDNYVEQALYFSRLNDFNKDYMIQEILVEKVLKSLIKSESKTFISKRILLEFNTEPMVVLSDQKALSYILRQILVNSLKYTSPNGKIIISVNSNLKTITIFDDGIGIPATDLPRVFEKGFTGKNGRNYQHSTGMGLYLANEMAAKLSHKLSIASIEGKYTEITIHFPELISFHMDY